MITLHEFPPIVQPRSWILAFQRTADRPWISWLACGRYKHVRAYAYVPGFSAWLFYDVRLSGTDLILAHDGPEAVRFIGAWTEDSDILTMTVRSDHYTMCHSVIPRFGFWCVPAIKHLIGLPSGALRPDRLWRDCIAAGGIPQGPTDETETAAVRRPARARPGPG